MTTDVITLGCRLNAYESEVIRRNADVAGLDDAVVINTCAVTNEAVRQARQTIRKARRDRSDAWIIVTGCAAQVEPETFAAMPEVSRVLGNQEKLQPAAFGIAASERVQVDDINSVRETAGHLLIDGLMGRSRAHVQVQNGCDHRCTFCIIPYGRGNSRSIPAGVVVDQVRRLVDKGIAEIVLTGVDITSWGEDLPGTPPLGRLVGQILAHVPDLPRLRLSSLDAVEIDDRLMELVTSEARVMPHLHLSLQAGDNMILKRMKRRHSREQAIALVEAIHARRPEVAFGCDIIAGFPTETEDMFEGSLALLDDCRIAYAHVFPFSPKQGTPAARMPQLARDVVKDRARRLRMRGAERLAAHLSARVGSVADVLMERGKTGHTADFSPVTLDGGAAGELVHARIIGSDGTRLTAIPLAA